MHFNQLPQWATLLGLTLWIPPNLRAREAAAKPPQPGMLFHQPAPGNPVMQHPDARWHEGATPDGMRGGISCRDVSVIEDAFTDEWAYACFVASTGRGDYYRRGCIGLARSGCVVLVDPKRKELQIAEIQPIYDRGIILSVQERHNITSPVGSDFKLSVVQSRDYQMAFVNGVLAATYSFSRRDPGRVGLFLENDTGTCLVAGIHARPDPADARTDHAARGKPVALAQPYHATHPAAGADALTDGKRGRLGSPLSSNWQGFAGVALCG